VTKQRSGYPTITRRVLTAFFALLLVFVIIGVGLFWYLSYSIGQVLGQQPAGVDVWNAAQRLAFLEVALNWPIVLGAVTAVLLLIWLIARWVTAPMRHFTQEAIQALQAEQPNWPQSSWRELATISSEMERSQRRWQTLHSALEQTNATLVEEQRRLTALLAISQEMGSLHDVEQSARRVATILVHSYGYERAAAVLVDEQALIYYFSSNAQGGNFEPPVRTAIDERSCVGWAVASGNLERVDNLLLEAMVTPAPGSQQIRAELVAPVIQGRRVVAALLVQSSQPGRFSEQDERTLVDLAAQLAVALTNSGRLRGERHRRQLVEAVFQVSQTLNAALRPESVYELILEQLAQVLPYDRSVLLVVEGEHADILAVRGAPGNLDRSRLLLNEYPLLSFVITKEQPVVLADARTNLGYRALPGWPAAVSWLGVPLLHQGRHIGVLIVESMNINQYRQDDVQAMAAITGQAAIVLDNARLSARTAELTRQLEIVTNVTQLVNTRDVGRSVPGLMRTIIHQIRLVVVCDLAVIALFDDQSDQVTLEVVYNYAVRDPNDLPEPQVLPVAGTAWEAACNNRSPIEQQDLSRSTFAYDQELVGRGFRSSVVVPILGGDRRFGGLGFASRQTGVFGQAQISTLLEIALQLGTMLHKERLSREREEAAAELARSREHLNMVDKVRLVGQLASGVAHDFNNLLTGILGNAQLLLMEIDDPEQREMLQVIERGARDGTETVRRIQGFARVQPDEALSDVRIDMLVRDSIDITRPQWRDVALGRGATIEIVRDLQPVPIILARSGELREVFSNLIINAADAMPRGGTLMVRTAYEQLQSTDTDEIVVTVSDTGTGIPPEVRARIFEPFFTTKGEKGTGLGLPVSLGIVQSHGGEITVQSEVGVGTTFTVRLPMRDDVRVHATVHPPSRNQHQAIRPARILLVESEIMVRLPISRLLKYWGHQVTQASCAAEVFEQFAPGQFDLVISDLSMPDMQGIDLLTQLKQQEPALQTILLTGWGQFHDTQKQLATVNAVLEKPFDKEMLRAVLAELLPPL
jgi:signal transduction histidine kinase/CheY-like chemotaxis protein